MINLIKAEIKKIFHKKSLYILTIIFIFYTILTNVIYKNLDDYENVDKPIDVKEVMKANQNLDISNTNDLLEYINNLVIIDSIKLKEEFNNNIQIYLIDNFLSDLIYKSYEYQYIDKDDNKYNEINEEISMFKERISNTDWQYFVNLKKANALENIDKEKDSLVISRYKELLKLYDYRLENNIAYDSDNYLNNAIEEMEVNMYEYINLQNKDSLSVSEKERLNYLNELFIRNEYILKNKEDVNNNESLRNVLVNFPSEFGLFILIYILMISGSIVSEEYSKGTIKYLLTKPYRRSTILVSKLLTVILLVPTIILFMVLIEIISGGLILGFSSLKVPVLIYDSVRGILVNYNIFVYLFKNLLYTLPMYIVICTFCFTLSTVTMSTSSATTITFLFYLICNIISNLALSLNFKWFKIFVSLHWDFSYIINFVKNPYNIKPWMSILIIFIYLCLMLCISFIYFNKKDIKNI